MSISSMLRLLEGVPLSWRPPKRAWEQGRGKTGYEKLPILVTSFCDCYLLRYPEGSYIPEHKDELPWQVLLDLRTPSWWTPKHFRLNVVVKEALEGGKFRCQKTLFQTRRLAFFRPDKYAHEVTKILRGTRYVLTFGVVL